MRKLASLVTIDKIYSIEGADKIVRATMVGKGWNVVVQKGEFSEGDLAVYCEIDSFLDSEDERYAFLRDRCLRKFVSKSGNVLRQGLKIKTIKLKGVVSQGLLLPLAQFVGEGKEITSIDREPVYGDLTDENGNSLPEDEVKKVAADGVKVSELYYIKHHEAVPAVDDQPAVDAYDEKIVVTDGSDLTELLKVEHFDEVKEQMTPVCGGGTISADAYGSFPSGLIPKTDEERIQNLADWITKYADRKFELTAKDDGSSCTMFYSPSVDSENPFGVCSRNIRQKPVKADGTAPAMWLMAKKYLVEEKLKALYENEGKEWALQGEFVSPSVQSNRDKYTEPEWHVFRIWDIKEQKFVEPSVRREWCKKNGLQHVQVIAEEMPIFKVHTSVEAILKFAEGKTARGNEREGIVFKSSDGLEPRLSFKAVSNRYLLHQED